MDSPTRTGPQLQAVSPERVNRLPQSPSLSNMDPFVASPIANSVQGKVAQFNNLNKEATQKRRDNEAALRRAVLGREEAESETKRLKEENAMLRAKLEEARARDQRVAKKFEAFSQEKRTLIEHQHKVQKISDQEVRRARKEAFKFSSALVQAQEDLQRARGHLEELKDQADVERNRGKKYQQEAFDAKLALSDVEDELEALKKQMAVVQEERRILRTNLDEEQIARVAAEGRIPLPSADANDEFASPRKSKSRRISRRVSSRRESLKENMDPALRASNDIFDIMWAAEEGDEFAVAKRNLWVEEKRRQEAEMMISYLKAEYEHRPKACECGNHSQDHQAPETLDEADATHMSEEPRVGDTGVELEAEDHHMSEVDVAQPANTFMECESEGADGLDDDTIIHHECAHEEQAAVADDDVLSPSLHDVSAVSSLVPSDLPGFTIHEDEDDEAEGGATPLPTPPAAPDALMPVKASVSPSLFDLAAGAEKENPHRFSQPRLSRSRISSSGLDMADTSILSIKSEDVDDSEQSNLQPLMPRAVPNQILSPVEPSRETTKSRSATLKVVTDVVAERSYESIEVKEPSITSFSSRQLSTPSDPKAQAAVTPVFRSTTTTTSVPLKSSSPGSSSSKDFPFSPGATMTREQALEAIKQRRRRARSIHDGDGGRGLADLLRRDVSSKSAPA